MLVTTVFVIVTMSHAFACMLNYRFGILFFLFLYPIYPKFFALGVSSEGFALTGQRLMIFVLAAFYVLRFLWGSAEIREGLESLRQYRGLSVAVFATIFCRIAGNLVTNRVDLGSIAALAGEVLITLFIFMLVVTYVRTKREVGILLSVIVGSFLICELAATLEYFSGASLFPAELDVQYKFRGGDDEDLVAGDIRADSYRAMAFFDNSLELAGLIILLLPLAIANASIASTVFQRAISYLAVLFAIPTAIFSGSRTAVGCCLVIAAWYIYIAISRGMSRLGKIFLAFLGCTISMVAILGAAPGFVQRMLFAGQYGSSAAYRLFQYVRAAEKIVESPVFGYGFARNIADIVNIRPLDSYYLRMVLEGGFSMIFSLFAMFYLCYALLRVPSPAESSKYYGSLGMGLGVSITVAVVASTVLSFPNDRLYIFLVAGLCFAYGRLKAQNKGPV